MSRIALAEETNNNDATNDSNQFDAPDEDDLEEFEEIGECCKVHNFSAYF